MIVYETRVRPARRSHGRRRAPLARPLGVAAALLILAGVALLLGSG